MIILFFSFFHKRRVWWRRLLNKKYGLASSKEPDYELQFFTPRGWFYSHPRQRGWVAQVTKSREQNGSPG